MKPRITRTGRRLVYTRLLGALPVAMPFGLLSALPAPAAAE